jgi:hypothetical protein
MDGDLQRDPTNANMRWVTSLPGWTADRRCSISRVIFIGYDNMRGLCGLLESVLGVTANRLNDDLTSFSSNHIFMDPVVVFMN